jgi:hypothetical protein
MFIKTNIPPTDKCLPSQLLNFLSILSSITFRLLLGIPRYLKGKEPFLHPNNCAYCSSQESATPVFHILIDHEGLKVVVDHYLQITYNSHNCLGKTILF